MLRELMFWDLWEPIVMVVFMRDDNMLLLQWNENNIQLMLYCKIYLKGKQFFHFLGHIRLVRVLKCLWNFAGEPDRFLKLLPGNSIGSCNSRSHGPIKCEDFFNLISDHTAQKGSKKRWYCLCSMVAYELEKKSSNWIGPYDRLLHDPNRFPRKISRTFQDSYQSNTAIFRLPVKMYRELLHCSGPQYWHWPWC